MLEQAQARLRRQQAEWRRLGTAVALLLAIAGVVGAVRLFSLPPDLPNSNPNQAAGEDAASQQALTDAAMQMVREKLRDPKAAQFSHVQIGSGRGNPVVCGYVNGRNAYGGYSGRQAFVVGNEVLLGEDIPTSTMDEVWKAARCTPG